MRNYFRNGSYVSAAVFAVGMTAALVYFIMTGGQPPVFMVGLTLSTILMVVIAVVYPVLYPIMNRRRGIRFYVEAVVRHVFGDNKLPVAQPRKVRALYDLTVNDNGYEYSLTSSEPSPVAQTTWVAVEAISFSNLTYRVCLHAQGAAQWSPETPVLVILRQRNNWWTFVPFLAQHPLLDGTEDITEVLTTLTDPLKVPRILQGGMGTPITRHEYATPAPFMQTR